MASKKTKKPKAVLAWAPVDNQGLWCAFIRRDDAEANRDADERSHLIRVRIVPVAPARRGKRRAKR